MTEHVLIEHFMTIEFYAGLTTGALAWRTVAQLAGSVADRVTGRVSGEAAETDGSSDQGE